MKRLLLLLFATVALMAQSCSLDELKSELDTIKNRISTLETSMSQLSDYQSIKDKVNNGKFIVTHKRSQDGSYTITFSDNTSITIRDGQDGKDGIDGQNGKDGIDGTNGKDGQNGKDGEDGEDGADGKTPTFKIENENWYVSYDDGGTWTVVGSAIDRSLFKAVTHDADYMYLKLADDSILTVPIGERNVFSLVMDESAIVMAADNGEVMKTRRMNVPFTLTGKLDDPRFLFTIDLVDKETPGLYLEAKVKWNSDKNGGFIEIYQPGFSFYSEGYRDNYIIFPAGMVNILAVNGDGQSSLRSKYVNDETMEIFFDYDEEYTMTRTNENCKYFDMAQPGGNIYIEINRYVGCKGYPDISSIVRAGHNSDVFYTAFYEETHGVVNDATVTNNPYNPTIKTFVDHFTVDYLVNPNTEGIERTVWCDIGRLDSITDPNSTTNDMCMVLTQDY